MSDMPNSAAKFEITRQDLYEQIWVIPANKLGEKLGVSGSYLARVCDALNVPRPPLGYWQKRAVGRAKPRPDLPEARPGDQVVWSKDIPLDTHAPRERRPRVSATAKSRPVQISRHPILAGAEAYFRKTRKISSGDFLRPYKQLLPDIVTTETRLPQALDLANTLYNSLEAAGHRVTFAPTDRPTSRPAVEFQEHPRKDRKYGDYGMGQIWSPHRPTVTYLGPVPVGLALTEMTERVTMRKLRDVWVREDSDEVKRAKPWTLANSWTTDRDMPCGRFRLVAYSPIRGVKWQQSWQDLPEAKLADLIPAILKKLESSAAEIARLMSAEAEAEVLRVRAREEEWERYSRAEDARRIKETERDSRKQLAEIIAKWAEAVALERFFEQAEARAATLTDARRERLQSRLALARDMIGTLDPLDVLEDWRAPGERYQSKYTE